MNVLQRMMPAFVSVVAMSVTAAVACYGFTWVTNEVAGFAVVGAAIAILFGEKVTKNFIWRGIWPTVGGAFGGMYGADVSQFGFTLPAYQAWRIMFGVVVGAVGFGSLFVLRREKSAEDARSDQIQIDETNGYRFSVWACAIGFVLGVICAAVTAFPFDEKLSVLWNDAWKLTAFGLVAGFLVGLPHLLAWLAHSIFAETK